MRSLRDQVISIGKQRSPRTGQIRSLQPFRQSITRSSRTIAGASRRRLKTFSAGVSGRGCCAPGGGGAGGAPSAKARLCTSAVDPKQTFDTQTDCCQPPMLKRSVEVLS
ncbi:hypothetical protein BBR47_02810 [Brevibacillus brevis NBRC 100599]|uniref:Uncharacterized protein n=1 Tax=Brevibacillus brevis (strain 47 / JCM 6285 / NBRC 100599) TaxID=358681 RepID=C0ZIP0_BREBN|nr:hypothetical protein BBR47_02810 [Brevibacillus brevis NBRC 100599]